MKIGVKSPGYAAATMAMVVALSACASVDMEQRLQKLEDRAAIEQLIFGEYPRALDGRDWKAYAATFAREGVLVQGTQETKGPAAIEEQFSRPRTPPTPSAAAAVPATGAAPPREAPIASKHVISNFKIISLTPDRAETTAYWETVSTRSTGTVIAGAGHYNDTLIKEDGQWKFLRREIVNPSRGPAPATAAAAPASPAAPAP
ncbi:MAG: nuclear transport factor 2 family protein [Hyphomonadaceae bacterium]|nr:nuclear transport factor 2 family protein [Hyphomonadaceae bacterium]